MPCAGQQVTHSDLPPLPSPVETIKDAKQFQAVQFGPGNQFTVLKTPPDFELAAIALSNDGHQLAIAWASGRVELWGVGEKKKIKEFKSGFSPQSLGFNTSDDQLLISGGGGKLALFSLSEGKKMREWKLPLGQRRFDLHAVILGPEGKWVAYADEDLSHVMDISGSEPSVIADLKNAGSLALSLDGKELWTADRTELARYDTATWNETGRWPLKSPPLNTADVVVRAAVAFDGSRTVAVPSEKGLVIYREPEMLGEYVTHEPTERGVFAVGSKMFVVLGGKWTFLDASGASLCERSGKVSKDYAMSANGQWLALAQFDSVELWRMDDLVSTCKKAP